MANVGEDAIRRVVFSCGEVVGARNPFAFFLFVEVCRVAVVAEFRKYELYGACLALFGDSVDDDEKFIVDPYRAAEYELGANEFAAAWRVELEDVPLCEI